MSLQVLQTRDQISSARQTLDSRGLSTVEPQGWLRRLIRRTGLIRTPPIGDWIKSWDVLQTVAFLEKRLAKADPVLDIGAYASEVLIALDKADFRDLTGVDLNDRLQRMPKRHGIKYVTSDFMNTPFADGSFAAITAISVIEHGYDGPRLMKEMSRLLRPGGVFVASFDYWPQGIDTHDTEYFGMSWRIFSRDAVEEMVEIAAAHGLRPVGSLVFDGKEKAVAHGGFNYTFGWIALEKTA